MIDFLTPMWHEGGYSLGANLKTRGKGFVWILRNFVDKYINAALIILILSISSLFHFCLFFCFSCLFVLSVVFVAVLFHIVLFLFLFDFGFFSLPILYLFCLVRYTFPLPIWICVMVSSLSFQASASSTHDVLSVWLITCHQMHGFSHSTRCWNNIKLIKA